MLFVRFLFFTETEDALAKLIFLVANKCLSRVYFCLLMADSFSTFSLDQLPKSRDEEVLGRAMSYLKAITTLDFWLAEKLSVLH